MNDSGKGELCRATKEQAWAADSPKHTALSGVPRLDGSKISSSFSNSLETEIERFVANLATPTKPQPLQALAAWIEESHPCFHSPKYRS
jgi:hypothetical protein